MSYVVRLPDPLQHKIAGWGLPTEVEVAFWRQFKDASCPALIHLAF